ncbi:MAG: sel1 repeat family protein [Muribaculaceae bacterium]|nr:sel1 repeat family protein [Muribaculaceae bacterium]
MKRIIPIIFLLTSLIGGAQRLKVTSFNIQPDDLTARDQPRVDRDGQLCALLKISVLDKLTDVEGTMIGDIVSKGVEKWVYVTDHTKKIKLHFENHFPLMITFDDFNYPAVMEKMVYSITLEEDSASPAYSSQGADTYTSSALPDSNSPSQPTVSVITPEKSSTTVKEETPKAIVRTTEEILNDALDAYKKEDYSKALELFKSIEGKREAQYYIGLIYFNGLGVNKDKKKGFKLLENSAKQGYDVAQFDLGYIYDKGYNGKPNYKKAAQWYMKSSEQNNAMAQCNLGYLYNKGQGVKQDHQVAAIWYRKSADQGNASAQKNLAQMYMHGTGVSQDYSEALRLLLLSAEQGNTGAKNDLGYIYLFGLGVEKNKEEAIRWFKESAEAGNEYAKENLRKLGIIMK